MVSPETTHVLGFQRRSSLEGSFNFEKNDIIMLILPENLQTLAGLKLADLIVAV